MGGQIDAWIDCREGEDEGGIFLFSAVYKEDWLTFSFLMNHKYGVQKLHG